MEVMKTTKVYKATWETNYGQRVALIEAESKEQATALIKEQAWDDLDIEEVVLTGTPQVLSVEGGDHG